jgi:mono/diheme cytochrome c family protein
MKRPPVAASSRLTTEISSQHKIPVHMSRNRRQSFGGITAALTLTIILLLMLSLIPAVKAEDAASNDDQAKIDAGENVYNMRCAVCHGDDLVNTGQTFDLRKLKADERPRFENSVHNGKNQMPPWKGVLTDENIDQLWHYIRAHAYEK